MSLDLTALQSATTVAQVLGQLPQVAPDIITHVVLGGRTGERCYPALVGQVLAVDATPPAQQGYLFVQTLGGPVKVQRSAVLVRAALCGDYQHQQSETWSQFSGRGCGHYASHDEAVASLPARARAVEAYLNR